MNKTLSTSPDYSKIDKKVDKIIDQVSLYMHGMTPEGIKAEIQKAYIFARDAHQGVFRISGEPYIDHPVEATKILLDLKPDIYTIQACLLHDVIEDTDRTQEDIKREFGEEVAHICYGITKLSKVRYFGEERSVGSLRKMFVAMSEDIRVIFVKLSDRLHNMQTLKYHPTKEKRDRIALETLNVYAPIADRLGLFSLKNELDKECFHILYPKEYRRIKKELSDATPTMKAFQESAKKEVDALLKTANISYTVDFRIKSMYSIYKKLQRKQLEHITELYDLFGIKIMVTSIEDCYRVLGMVHNIWTPVPKRFKDYIALPKPNGYQSLHTTVIGLLKKDRKQPTEIQIKTYQMDIQAGIGIAAHFEYKEKGSRIAQDIEWVKQLNEMTQKLENNEFMDSLQIDLFKDRIFVLTPMGKSINLPTGSTPIDFAYEIHTDLGHHITLAKVNGQPIPLDKELKNGDVVEVVTDKNKVPNPFYLSFVKTTKAKNNIRSFLRTQDKGLHIEKGKDIINNLLERFGLEKLDKEYSLLKVLDGKNYSLEKRIELLEQIGNSSTNPTAIVRKVLKQLNVVQPSSKQKDTTKAHTGEEEVKKREIVIGGLDDVDFSYGTCCENNISDKIVAYINSKGKITIHNRDCPTLARLSKDRMLHAYFKGDELRNIIFDIEFVVKNKLGLLKEISEVLVSMNIDVLEIASKRIGVESTSIYFKLEIYDHDYLIIDRFVDRMQFKLGQNFISAKVGKIGSI